MNYTKMSRDQQNAILRQHGYRWQKVTQDWLDDNDDFDTVPGWYLHASDGREVEVHEAFDEINRGSDVVLAEKREKELAEQAEHRRKREVKSAVDKITRYVKEFGEVPADAEYPNGDELFDTTNIYGSGEVFVVQPDNTIWLLVKNGMDGDNWSRNNLPGYIAYRLAVSEDEDELNQSGNGNAAIVQALRQLGTGQPLEASRLQSFRI